MKESKSLQGSLEEARGCASWLLSEGRDQDYSVMYKGILSATGTGMISVGDRDKIEQLLEEYKLGNPTKE